MRQHRPDYVLERAEFLSRARSMARRGVALTHSKLTPAEVQEIRQAKENRLDLMAHISETLSNSALAEKYGVHPRTIEKVLSYETWSHIK
jgi:hypothetical protein